MNILAASIIWASLIGDIAFIVAAIICLRIERLTRIFGGDWKRPYHWWLPMIVVQLFRHGACPPLLYFLPNLHGPIEITCLILAPWIISFLLCAGMIAQYRRIKQLLGSESRTELQEFMRLTEMLCGPVK